MSLRVSYGFNGIIMKYNDLFSFSNYLNLNFKLKPIDHLFYDYSMMISSGGGSNTKTEGGGKGGKKRNLFSFRYNLFYHIGKKSTIQINQSNERYIPNCYQILYDWLQPFERFRNEDCPTEDISPCKNINKTEEEENQIPQLIDFDLNFKQICRSHFPICDHSIKTIEESKEKSCRIRK